MDDETLLLPTPDCVYPNFFSKKWGRPVNIWVYQDEHSNVLGFICRYDTPEGKQILPYTFWGKPSDPRGTWKCRSWPVPRPLYGLDRLAACPDAIVVVCEGEKAADAAQLLLPMPQYVCITSPGGSNAADKARWEPVQNRRVMIWADNDVAGEKYASAVSAILGSLNNEVYILSVPLGKTQGWDAADALAEGWQNA